MQDKRDSHHLTIRDAFLQDVKSSTKRLSYINYSQRAKGAIEEYSRSNNNNDNNQNLLSDY